jgi:hypothetical protein
MPGNLTEIAHHQPLQHPSRALKDAAVLGRLV